MSLGKIPFPSILQLASCLQSQADEWQGRLYILVPAKLLEITSLSEPGLGKAAAGRSDCAANGTIEGL